ncbi:MAG TPA: phosphatase PAP2 family protein [Elusimicrobiota bacterium]|jgi:membrane-associated phospholipid phosphatase|nr:phosphatase PAP2 family protein [Elusimicrobiota bacterium]
MTRTPINRAVAYPLTYLFVLGGYILTERCGGWTPAHFLPMTAVDRAVPFMPWTGWIYATVFPFPLLAAALVRDDRGVRAMLAAFLGVTTVLFAVFLAYPTAYPRPELAGGGLSSLPLALIYRIDLPRNCLPSGHVTAAFLTAFAVRQCRPRLGAALIFWAAVISVSTLTTKQHYFWDVIAGVLLSSAGYAAAHLYFAAPRPAEVPTLGR